MNYPLEATDHRSQELMQRLYDKIDLADNVIFTNELIEIQYRINGKQRSIILDTPADIAAFAQHNNLITRYEKTRGGIKMYAMQILPATDRRGYPYQCVGEVEIKRIPSLFRKDEIKVMVARYEYDYGDIADKWNDIFVAPKGVVREMFPFGTNNNTKRTA